jgi:hypothetical protein
MSSSSPVQEWAFTDCIQTISYPVVILIGIALIIHTIGVSGLAGIGVSFSPSDYWRIAISSDITGSRTNCT